MSFVISKLFLGLRADILVTFVILNVVKLSSCIIINFQMYNQPNSKLLVIICVRNIKITIHTLKQKIIVNALKIIN